MIIVSCANLGECCLDVHRWLKNHRSFDAWMPYFNDVLTTTDDAQQEHLLSELITSENAPASPRLIAISALLECGSYFDPSSDAIATVSDVHRTLANVEDRSLYLESSIALAMMYATAGRHDEALELLVPLNINDVGVDDVNEQLVLRAENIRGVIDLREGSIDTAEQRFRRIIAEARPWSSATGAAQVNLGIILAERGHTKEAMLHCEQQIRISRRLGDVNGLCCAFTSLANIFLSVGLSDYALLMSERACRLLSLGVPLRVRSLAVSALATVLLGCSGETYVEALCTQHQQLFGLKGYREGELQAWCLRLIAALQRNDNQAALTLWRSRPSHRPTAGSPIDELIACIEVDLVLRHVIPGDAREMLIEARTSYGHPRHSQLEVYRELLSSLVYQRRGDTERSNYHAQRALEAAGDVRCTHTTVAFDILIENSLAMGRHDAALSFFDLERRRRDRDRVRITSAQLQMVETTLGSLLVKYADTTMFTSFHEYCRSMAGNMEALEGTSSSSDVAGPVHDSVQSVNRTHTELVLTHVHDVKNCLAALRGLSAAFDPIGGDANEYRQHVLGATNELYRLTVDTLNHLRSKEQGVSSRSQCTSVRHVAVGVLQQVYPRAIVANATLSLDISEDSCVQCDEFVLHRILSNVVTNAIQHTENGGHVVIASKLLQHYVLITIRDQGTGLIVGDTSNGTMSEERSGIGLELTRRLVTRHHGQLRIECGTHGGTDVHILLPVAENASAESRRG